MAISRTPKASAQESASARKTVLRAGTEDKARFRVLAPLIGLSKAEIVREGTRLGVDYGMTRSCYFPAPDGLACGRCDACRLRLKGFADAGIPDPLRYRCQACAGAAEFSQIQRNPS